MATYYIKQGATDLSVAANYNTAEDGTGTDATNLSDLDSNDVVLSRGTQTITSGATALATHDLTSFTIKSGFRGSFGADGTSISLLLTAGSPSKLNIESSGANVFITSPSTIEQANIAMNSGGQVRFTGGTVTACYISGGAVYYDGAIVTNTYMTGGTLTVATLGTALTLISVTGGSAYIERAVTTAHIDGVVTSLTMSGSAAMTTGNVYGGATLKLQSSAATNVTTLNLFQGTVTPAGARKDQVITTVNNYGPAGKARLVTQYGMTLITPGTYNDFGRAGQVTDAKGGGGSAEYTP